MTCKRGMTLQSPEPALVLRRDITTICTKGSADLLAFPVHRADHAYCRLATQLWVM